MYATATADQEPGPAILPDRPSNLPLITVYNRRIVLSLAVAVAVSGFTSACGVKGPLYLPEENETDEEEKQDKEKTSRRSPAMRPARHG